MEQHDEFASLVRRARAFDPDALSELYRRHVTQVYRFALSRLGRPDEAEEVTSETFMAMLRNIRRYRGEAPALFSAWLHRIARSRIADVYRRQKRKPSVPLEDSLDAALAAVVDPDAELERRLDRERLLHALHHLTAEQREIVLLKYFAGYSNTEVAAILRKTAGAVNSMQHRALANLRRVLLPEGERAAPAIRLAS